jgi:hypothetical protein
LQELEERFALFPLGLRRLGLAIFVHWSMGTMTAVSTPRWVMICGPCFLAASMTSLSFALACCSCHVAMVRS